jgi:hypothetical protein
MPSQEYLNLTDHELSDIVAYIQSVPPVNRLAGDPNMPIVANPTRHETGLKSWTEVDFMRSLREGVRKDGTAISEMMPWKAYGRDDGCRDRGAVGLSANGSATG